MTISIRATKIQEASSAVRNLRDKGITSEELRPLFECLDFFIKKGNTCKRRDEYVKILWQLHSLQGTNTISPHNNDEQLFPESKENLTPRQEHKLLVGENIKALREKRYLSARELADKINQQFIEAGLEKHISADAVYSWELGRCKCCCLNIVARVLGVEPKELDPELISLEERQSREGGEVNTRLDKIEKTLSTLFERLEAINPGNQSELT